MRVTRRFWALAAAGGAFAVLAVFLESPLYLGVPVIVVAWLAAHQFAFTADLNATVDELAVEQSVTPERALEGQRVQVTATATLETQPRNAYTLAVRPPLTMDAGDATATLENAHVSVHAAGAFDVAGRYTIEAPTLTATDQYGLFEESVNVGPETTAAIEPSAPRDAVVLADGDRVGVGYGDHEASQGTSGFAAGDLRKYVAGDPTNRIDWNATARLGEPYVRETDPETDRETIAVVDHRAALGDGPAGRTQLDYVREVALWLVDHAASYDDPVGLHTVGDDGPTRDVDAQTGQRHFRRLKQALYDLTPTARSDTRASYDVANTPEVEADGEFGATLAPFFEARAAYVRRVESDPLFETVRGRLARRTRSPWLVVLTDDSNRAELVETVKLAHRENAPVTVFICANALFDADGVTDVERAYSDYREFREFTSTLAEHGAASVYEVGPENRIDAVLAASAPTERRTP